MTVVDERIKEKEEIINNLKQTIRMLEQEKAKNPLKKEVAELKQRINILLEREGMKRSLSEALEDQLNACTTVVQAINRSRY